MSESLDAAKFSAIDHETTWTETFALAAIAQAEAAERQAATLYDMWGTLERQADLAERQTAALQRIANALDSVTATTVGVTGIVTHSSMILM